MEPAPFAIRHPREDDVEDLAQLHVSTWRETYAHLLPGDYFSAELLDQRRQMWAWIVQNPSDERPTAVAEAIGKIVGLAASGPTQDEDAPRGIELKMIYVPRSHHGTGIGQALLEQVVGQEKAFLWVAKDNRRAQSFYRRNRFEPDGAERTDETTPAIIDIRMVR